MPILIDISNDRLYKQGKFEGEIEGKLEGKLETSFLMVESLLMDTDFTHERIALLTRVPLAEVEKIHQKIKK